MGKRLTTQEFIDRARDVHGDKYDYSKVEYVNANTKVCIVCPKHGEFWQVPSSHFGGIGCKKCTYEKISFLNTKTTEQFIKDSIKVHGDKYDYSKVEYVNSHEKVCIICPKHGEFLVMPYSHLNGRNCPLCSHRSTPYSTEEWIENAKKMHHGKYDYSKVNYTNGHTKVCIICPKHGEFWQTPQGHLSGKGCSKCKGQNKTTEDFVKELKLIYCDKYDYSKVEYANAYSKVCIICPTHGEFWVRPNDILNHHGCPSCNNSRLENKTLGLLQKKNIALIQRCGKSTFKWLGKQHLDFYLPQYNMAIECQGRQHFEVVEHFGGKDKLKYTQRLDARKKQLCKENGVKLHYINYDDDVETKLEKILKETCQNT